MGFGVRGAILILAVYFMAGLPAAFAAKTPSKWIPKCDSVDLNADENSPLRKIPVYDQGKSGTCYAQAGSVVLDYYRLKKDPNAQLSNPLFMATQSKLDDLGNPIGGEKRVHGGQAADAINAVRKRGLCKSAAIDQCFEELHAKFPDKANAEIVGLIDRVLKGESPTTPAPECESEEDSAKALREFVAGKGWEGKFSVEVLRETFGACQGNLISLAEVPAAIPYYNVSEEKMGLIVDVLLNEGTPISLSMASPVLREVDARCVKVTADKSRKTIKTGGACKNAAGDPDFLHEVVITGKKVIDGKCQLLIRNSWGEDWRAKVGPGKLAKCACEMLNPVTGQRSYHEICPDTGEIRDGEAIDMNAPYAERILGCWVPADAVLENSVGFTVVRDANK